MQRTSTSPHLLVILGDLFPYQAQFDITSPFCCLMLSMTFSLYLACTIPPNLHLPSAATPHATGLLSSLVYLAVWPSLRPSFDTGTTTLDGIASFIPVPSLPFAKKVSSRNRHYMTTKLDDYSLDYLASTHPHVPFLSQPPIPLDPLCGQLRPFSTAFPLLFSLR